MKYADVVEKCDVNEYVVIKVYTHRVYLSLNLSLTFPLTYFFIGAHNERKIDQFEWRSLL